jgi:hypothetical protein
MFIRELSQVVSILRKKLFEFLFSFGLFRLVIDTFLMWSKQKWYFTDRFTTTEPLFNTKANAWEFTVTRKFLGGDAVKGTYHASNKMLGLEWNKDSKTDASFKVRAYLSSTPFLQDFWIWWTRDYDFLSMQLVAGWNVE